MSSKEADDEQQVRRARVAIELNGSDVLKSMSTLGYGALQFAALDSLTVAHHDAEGRVWARPAFNQEVTIEGQQYAVIVQVFAGRCPPKGSPNG